MSSPHPLMIMWASALNCIPLTFVHGQQQIVSGTQILIHFTNAPDRHHSTHDPLCFPHNETRPVTVVNHCVKNDSTDNEFYEEIPIALLYDKEEQKVDGGD